MASVTLNLSVWEKSYSIENNTSEIGWSLSVTSSNAYNGYDNQCPYIVKYNNSSGSTVASGNKGFANNKTTQLASGTISNYKHNDNGKASITLYAHYTTGVSPATATITKTIDLTTIPRASSVAVSNYNLGQNISIAIGKKVNSFTSTLTYKIGSRTGTIATKTSNSTYVWEMSDELISQIKQDNPSNAKPSAIIYCDTYSGDTKIGDTKSTTFTLTIVDKPTIDNVSIVETIEKIKQYTTSIVKYLSAPQFNISSTPSEGTTISTYRVKIDEKEFTSSSNELIANNIQYSYLADEVRKTKFIITVTDARGNTSEEKPIEMDFIEYVKLAFNNTDITLTRLNGTSSYIKLHMTGYIYNGFLGETANTLSLGYRYKLKNDTTAEWSELKTLIPTLNEDNTFIIEEFQLEDEFDYRENYDIEFYAQDLFLSTYFTTIIKTSETIAKWHKNGAYIKEVTTKKIQLNGVDLASLNFCKMSTSSKISFASDAFTKVTDMVESTKCGDYYVEGDAIVVTNTRLLELGGAIAGRYSMWAYIYIYEKGEYLTCNKPTLVQPDENYYFATCLNTDIIKLDPTKTYHIYLYVTGYNGKTFEMNMGFNNASTYIIAKKIL